ncbi:MAG: ribonuclease P protein component [Candidatus Omnitrophica bacterium]|nr:ribonuclease P protein component [Candidatus Omnitrophota bacterium]
MQGSIKIAVPRALFPLSTARNRLKRQIREAIRLSHQEKGKDILIVVKKRGAPSFGAIQKELCAHLKNLGILR